MKKLKKVLALLLLAALLSALLLPLSSCGEPTEKLYLYNWGEYMPLGTDGSENVLELFEAYYEETYGKKIEVVYSIFSSNEEMYAKLQNGSSKIDLVIPSDYMVERLKQHKRDSLALYNYRRTVREQRIEAKDREIERVRESQKKLQKNYSDFINLINFVKLIDDDDFWRAQIVEIIVSQSQNGELELRLIPRAGRHTIIFGRIEDVERKLDKLRRFYRIGLDREGWDRYRAIDIRFKGQVVCSPAAR